MPRPFSAPRRLHVPRPSRPFALRLAALSRRPWYPAAGAGVIAVVALAETVGGRISEPAVLVTTAGAVLPLPWRHRALAPAVCAVAAALLSFLVRPELLLSTALAGLTGLYACARRRPVPPAALIACGIAAAVLVNLGHVALGAYDLGAAGPALGADGSLSYFADSLVVACAVTATVLAADAARSREEYQRERAAARRRLVEMERAGAAAAERARIARELHDIVAHTVSVIAVQAETYTYTLPGLSTEARDGFQALAGSARASMAELRSLLDVLRQEDTAAATAPQPALADLPALLDTHRAAGGTVDLRVTGTRPSTTAAVELAVYRIVQEALTNARRHAPGAPVTCRIDHTPDAIRTYVANTAPVTAPAQDGPPGPTILSGSGGHGLDGMRERATLLGGTLDWHPTADGGFAVIARLPAPRSA
ncbi:MAG: histidine kinase [Kitasatospora sp.]|jgi:signal transduction histidine kinase|nr:histidine kinase [Kitasatospora sp.]